uniref:Uncharacterized protein n=1 Tax=Cacopsylla melanoneura TaxID=428564 RepID=A0A8D8S8R0_9HEMI
MKVCQKKRKPLLKTRKKMRKMNLVAKQLKLVFVQMSNPLTNLDLETVKFLKRVRMNKWRRIHRQKIKMTVLNVLIQMYKLKILLKQINKMKWTTVKILTKNN